MCRQIACIVIACCLGCSGEKLPSVYPVSGVVMRDGAPLADVNIEFLPSTGRPSTGTTDLNGKFVLEYLRGTRGALEGAHRVRVHEKFQGANPDAPAPAEPVVYVEPKSYEIPQPAEVEPMSNSFVIDVTAGTASHGN